MNDQQWIALRIVDSILSVAVYVQAWKLEQLLDIKDQHFLDKGYKKDRLSSPFIKMRRQQLRLISRSYLLSNFLILSEMIYLIFFMSDQYEACENLCSQPYDRKAAAILFLLSFCHVLPAQLNLWSFYFIPRRFHVEIYGMTDEDNIDIGIETPLLNIQNGLDVIDDDLIWNRNRVDSEHSSRGDQRSNPSMGSRNYRPPPLSQRGRRRRPGGTYNEVLHSSTLHWESLKKRTVSKNNTICSAKF